MKTLIPVAILITCIPAHAASTQIGDLRIGSNNYSGGFTYFDPGFAETTRAAVGAPVQVNSSFIGTTQNPGDAAPDSATDIGLQTYSVSTVIRQLNRYASDPDGPGGVAGTQTVGAVQWSFNLAPLGGYLSSNSLDLTALDLRLVTDPSDDTREYDVYLSYTNAAESMARTGISASSSADNYSTFWFPAQSAAEGAVVNNAFKVIELDFIGNMDATVNLLALYDAGITEFNLIMTSGAFLQNRTIGILDGSGISIDTAAIPEPSVALLSGVLGSFLLLRRRSSH